jgi:hypothetical protein
MTGIAAAAEATSASEDETSSASASQSVTEVASASDSVNFILLQSRYSRPESDLANGAWSSTGANLWSVLDEDPADDADYIYTATIGSPCTVRLQPVVDPFTNFGQVVYYRARSTGGNTLSVTLKQGAMTIASTTQLVTSSWATYSLSLTLAECDSITDYTNLRIDLDVS